VTKQKIDWLTGMIGMNPAPSRLAEMNAVVGSLEYAREQCDASNFDCENIDKAIALVKLQIAAIDPTTKKLSQYVGTLWKHTPKATKRAKKSFGAQAAPEDRVFVVVAVQDKQLLAWKCDLLRDGRLSHPAYVAPMYPDDPRLFCMRGSNGSDPTALFKPDSHYTPFIP